MPVLESRSIVVCATGSKELDATVRVMREMGGWVVVPVQWPDPAGFHAARDCAEAFILHSGQAVAGSGSGTLSDPTLDELTHLLLARPEGTPLIVLGSEPAARAEPTCWLPVMPNAALLGSLLS